MSDPPITKWIAAAKDGDHAAENGLWEHYFQSVVRLARSRMYSLQGTIYDEEDAAVSAMNSVFRGIRNDRFPALHDRDNLWRIIVLITRRKLRAQWRRESATRRHHVAEAPRTPAIPIEEVICDEPTSEFVAELMDETEHLLEKLNDVTLRRIMLMRMDGLTNDEVAAHLDCATRTVERKMERIRAILAESDEE